MSRRRRILLTIATISALAAMVTGDAAWTQARTSWTVAGPLLLWIVVSIITVAAAMPPEDRGNHKGGEQR